MIEEGDDIGTERPIVGLHGADAVENLGSSELSAARLVLRGQL